MSSVYSRQNLPQRTSYYQLIEDTTRQEEGLQADDDDIMCFQAFIHYACGHEEIIETACTYAEGLPFFIKHACLNYQSESMYPPHTFCGQGRYYCGKTGKDGPFLDEWHAKLAQSEADLQAIGGQHVFVKQKAVELKDLAVAFGVSKEVMKMHPTYLKLREMYIDLTAKQGEVEKVRKESKGVTDEAKEFFRYRRANGLPLENDVGQPALVLLSDAAAALPLELLPADSSVFNFLEPVPGESQIPEVPPFAYGLEYMHQPDFGLTSTVDKSTQATDTQPVTDTVLVNDGEASNAATPQKATDPTPQKAANHDDVFLHPSSATRQPRNGRTTKKNMEKPEPRRRRAPSPEIPPPTPAKDDGQPRRSGRARKQAVNYAEMSGSDYSRANSPAKSESSHIQSDYVESEDSPPKRAQKPQRKSNAAATRRQNKEISERVSKQLDEWKKGAGVDEDGT